MDVDSLETLILQLADDPVARAALIEKLPGFRVAIPLDKGLENGVLPAGFKPLTLNAPQGFPVLATFTTPDKAAPWIKEQPVFQHALVTEFAWAVGITRPPFGIAVNPGYTHSLLLTPSEVQALAERQRAAT
jgi:hypothetical protein